MELRHALDTHEVPWVWYVGTAMLAPDGRRGRASPGGRRLGIRHITDWAGRLGRNALGGAAFRNWRLDQGAFFE
jgi:hypothetical protein